MTDEELLARLLYRDGMMLVIDKPAGIAVHRGPKGGENLEDYFHACASACRAIRPWHTGSIARRPDVWCSGDEGSGEVPCEWNGRAEPGAWKRRDRGHRSKAQVQVQPSDSGRGIR